jgi:hypothetical protein
MGRTNRSDPGTDWIQVSANFPGTSCGLLIQTVTAGMMVALGIIFSQI